MLHDLRFALRSLRRSPGFALSAILALALGIGANTAVFSVFYAVLLKPLPYPQPEQLVRLSERSPEGKDTGTVSAGTFVDWRLRSRTLESIAVYTQPGYGKTLWAFGDRFETVRSAAVSPALFATLKVAPIVGRTFRPEDQQDTPSGDRGKLVISHALWQRVFGGAPDVVGRAVSVEGRIPGEIIGVMPRGFAFPEGTEAWTNLAFVTAPTPARRRAQSYHTIARLRPGVGIDDARAELRGISAQLANEQPASNRGWDAQIEPQAGSDTAAAKPALVVLLAAVSGVLLIGCASVANLLLARAAARRREMAVRKALGAGTFHLVRQCLTEAAVLAACGSAAGVVIGALLARVLVYLAPSDIPRLGDVGLNAVLLLYAAAAGLVSTIFVGLAPALQAARADRRSGLRPDARTVTTRSARLRRLLIAGEVAGVVLLLTGALLLVRTFVKLRAVDLGFHTDRALNVSARWPIGELFPSTPGVRPWPRIQRAVEGLIDAVAAIPGVDAVGLIADVPLTADPFSGVVWREDAPGAAGLRPPTDLRDRWRADLSIVTAGYFPAMGIPIVRGRNFAFADRLTDVQLNDATATSPGVAIVNGTFASKYFPGEDPIGRTLVISDDQTFGWSRTIIGVVGDVRARTVAEPAAPAVFVPHAQHPDVFVPSLIVRSTLPADVLAPAIRARIAAVDPPPLVLQIRPMEDVVSGALSRPRFNLVLLASFAGVALALSAVGIYGVLASLVGQRTREIGVRMALGARPADVLRLVMAEGMAPVVIGGAAGLVASAAATGVLRTLLFGVTPLDPVSFAVAPALVAAVASTACYLPARRATRVDPLIALREE